ncbi:MAG: hypothetical protein ACUZ8I_01280 [Candidatus Scalindua sp.]
MNLLIFKTDIKTKKEVKVDQPLFNNHPIITNWSIDTEDIDNVLRIEAQDDLSEKEIIHLIKECGFYGEMLAD